MRSDSLPHPPAPWPFFSDPARACRSVKDPEIFFPVRGGGTALAKKVCRDCPVKPDCREWGVRYESSGVWGGLSVEERSAERRRRAGARERRCETCRRTYTARTQHQRACGPGCASRLTKKKRGVA